MLNIQFLVSILFTVLMAGSGARTPTDQPTEITDDDEEEDMPPNEASASPPLRRGRPPKNSVSIPAPVASGPAAASTRATHTQRHLPPLDGAAVLDALSVQTWMTAMQQQMQELMLAVQTSSAARSAPAQDLYPEEDAEDDDDDNAPAAWHCGRPTRSIPQSEL